MTCKFDVIAVRLSESIEKCFSEIILKNCVPLIVGYVAHRDLFGTRLKYVIFYYKANINIS